MLDPDRRKSEYLYTLAKGSNFYNFFFFYLTFYLYIIVHKQNEINNTAHAKQYGVR